MEPATQIALENEGFALIPRVLTDAGVDHLRAVIETEHAHFARVRRAGRTYGGRNLLAVPQLPRWPGRPPSEG